MVTKRKGVVNNRLKNEKRGETRMGVEILIFLRQENQFYYFLVSELIHEYDFDI